jgi:hypothetical protein
MACQVERLPHGCKIPPDIVNFLYRILEYFAFEICDEYFK